jgi:hypothetical protein
MFKEKEIKEKLDKFVVLIVDVDDNPTLKKKYKVKSIPDYRILNSDLEVLTAYENPTKSKEIG